MSFTLQLIYTLWMSVSVLGMIGFLSATMVQIANRKKSRYTILFITNVCIFLIIFATNNFERMIGLCIKLLY